MSRAPFGGGKTPADFSTQTSQVASGEQTRIDGTQLIEKRKYRRILLDRPGTFEIEGRSIEGLTDLSRLGAGIVGSLEADPGKLGVLVIPPDEVDVEPLALPVRVVRSFRMCAPIEMDGAVRPTFHCFVCGWTGYLDAAGRLESSVRRSAEASLGFGGETRLDGSTFRGASFACATCGAPAPAQVDAPLYHVGLVLSAMPRALGVRLVERIEREVHRRGSIGRRSGAKQLAEYVPRVIPCEFASGTELAQAFLRELEKGKVTFFSGEDIRVGEEVRIALSPRPGAPGFVVFASVASRTLEETRVRYVAQLTDFVGEVQKELQEFVTFASGKEVERMVERELAQEGRRRFSRDLLLGLGVGFVVIVVALLLWSLR